MKRNQTTLGLEGARQRGRCDQRGQEQVVRVGSANPTAGRELGAWQGAQGQSRPGSAHGQRWGAVADTLRLW